MNDAQMLGKFLEVTLDGLLSFEGICSGQHNAARILMHPECYSLGHIGMDIDAWFSDNRLVFAFDGGCHFVFTPIEIGLRGLRFLNMRWQ